MHILLIKLKKTNILDQSACGYNMSIGQYIMVDRGVAGSKTMCNQRTSARGLGAAEGPYRVQEGKALLKASVSSN
jgi:hypothetical protein